MKKKIAFAITTVMVLTAGVFIQPQKSLAADDNNGSSNVSVSTNQPENQIDKNQSFFDVRMNPGQKQDLEVVLTNTTNEELTMLASANSAITNDNGVVDYSWKLKDALAAAKENNKDKTKLPIDLKTVTYDSTLKYPLSEIATMPEEINIPAKSQVIAKIQVKMPTETISGVIAGGVYLTQKEESTKDEDASKGVQIKNKFVYVVGIQLRQNEDISALKPDMKLDKKKILPTQVNYRNYLGINLQNTEAIYIRNLTVDAKVYQKGNNQVLHEAKQEGMKMAPNSNFNFGVNWENQEFKAGTYRVKVTAKAEDYDKTWSWDEEFTIERKTADKLNKQAVELEKPDYTIYYIIAGVTLIVFLLIILYLIKRHLDKKKEVERRRIARAKARKKRRNGKTRSESSKKTEGSSTSKHTSKSSSSKPRPDSTSKKLK
ncbi:DUF916 and DUF3324 domain-containing protein [Carnobacterium gallinarum]|uniref:DUF916 and DUF3324 domain-containing protein n=1 Tax=Carnobacterium gallinarum TaxID=2749 RepID=UPI000ADB393B|nr:DUF916 and DUF3324 domain-containing protein [Carnobacterium gallinarum]